MAKLKARAVLSQLKKGGKACYQLIPQLANTVDEATVVKLVANQTRSTETVARMYVDALGMVMRKLLTEARPFMLTDLFKGSLAIGGSIPTVNTALDPAKNPIKAIFIPNGKLSNVAKNLELENISQGVGAILYSIDQLGNGAILTSTEAPVYANGSKIGIDTSDVQTGVWLEDIESGRIVAVATVLKSDENTIDAKFEELPENGKYLFVVATRNCMGEEYSVERLTRYVEVKVA